MTIARVRTELDGRSLETYARKKGERERTLRLLSLEAMKKEKQTTKDCDIVEANIHAAEPDERMTKEIDARQH